MFKYMGSHGLEEDWLFPSAQHTAHACSSPVDVLPALLQSYIRQAMHACTLIDCNNSITFGHLKG